MAQSDSTMNIVVKAKNETEATFKKLKNDITSVKTSNESMATSVFKGVAAWDLLKTGVRETVKFLGDCVQASIDAQKEMAMVKQNVENSGVAFDSVKDKIAEYSETMMKMGFDDEETSLSVSKLMLVTNDYTKALSLNHLAADLARNKGIGLSEATAVVIKVAGGATKAVKEYDLGLKEGASAAENLGKMQDKLKGSTETFAKTTAGQMEIMKVSYGNLKEKIGDTFGPALNVALTNLNNFLSASSNNTGKWAGSIAEKLAILANPDTWKLTGKVLSTGLKQASWWITENLIAKPIAAITGSKYVKSQSPIEQNKQAIIDLANNIKETTDTAMALQDTMDVVGDTGKNSFDGIGAASTEATDKIKKQKDAMEDVLGKLKDYKKSIDDIKKSQEEESVSFIKSQIEKRQSFDQQLADTVAGHKEKWQQANKDVVELQKELAKNQEELSTETDSKRMADGLAKNKEFMQKIWELQATSEKEFKIVQPYLNNQEMTKLAETSDVERMVNAYKAEQASDTVATAEKQAELIQQAQQIYINFDLKDTTITDVNFIEKIKAELNKALNNLRFSN